MTPREQALEAALKNASDAIKEYERYFYGGETKGSYDGKPERANLWKALSQARAALAMPKEGIHTMDTPWQPIETAPKDGVPILLYPEHVVGRWSDTCELGEFVRGPGWQAFDPDDQYYSYAATKSTHWMPLPEPPKETTSDPNDWLPTPLADPPGDAGIETGDWVQTRGGCVLGPVNVSITQGVLRWSHTAWPRTGRYGRGDHTYDIIAVRKAVK